MRKAIVILLSFVMILAFAGCGSDSQSEDEQTQQAAAETTIQITMDISFPDDSGMEDIEDASVTVESGSSVLNALNVYADEADLEIEMDNASENPYVTGIGGILESDTAGWIYEVNDEMVMESADACILNDGDNVSWNYESWGE